MPFLRASQPARPGSPSTRTLTLAAMVVALNAFVLAMAWWSLARGRRNLQASVEASSQSLVKILELDLEGTIKQIDLTLAGVKYAMERQDAGGPSRNRAFADFLGRQKPFAPFLDSIRTADAQGFLDNGAGVDPSQRQTVSDRQYFNTLREPGDGRLVFSPPLLDRVTGQWGIMVGRRLERPGGGFAGIVFANVTLRRLTRTLAMVDLGPHGLVVLRGGDLGSIARYPPVPGAESLPGEKIAPEGLFERIRAGKTSGTFLNPRPVDGVSRTITFAKLEGLPFYIVVGVAARDYLAGWRKEAWQTSVIAGLFLILTLVGAWLVLAAWRRQREAERRSLIEEERLRGEKALRASEEKFQKAFRSSPDSININRFSDGAYLEVNAGFTRITGWSAQEVLGRSSLPGDLGLWVRAEDRARLLEGLKRDGLVEGLEASFRRKDGTLLTGLMSATLIEIEGEPCTLTITRDITQQKRQSDLLARLTQLYAATSQVNQAIVWSSTEQELLDRICEVMVACGRFSMAWIGLDDPVSHDVRVASRFGDHSGFLDHLRVRSDDSPMGQGPAAIAIRERKACVVNDYQAFIEGAPWQAFGRKAGYAASAAFPFRKRGEVYGALVAYAMERDFFGEHEVALLEEAAADLSFALDHLELDARRRQAEATLRLEHEKSERYLAVAEVILVAFDRQGRVTMLNRKGHAVLGHPDGTLVGQDWAEACLPPEECAGFRRMLENPADSEAHRENEVLRRDGERRLIAWHNSVIRDEAGAAIGILSSGEDITERRRAEREKAVLQAQLMQAQKMESLGSLAGGIAHDMNNVLGAILALSSVHLELQEEDGPVRQAFERIAQAATRGGKLVKGLLGFARKNPTEERAVDLNELLLEQAQMLEHTTFSRIRFRLELAPDLLPILGDASALAHAFMNLCVNAVDAMAGEGTLTLRSRNLDDDRVEVGVEDSGCGMSSEVLARALDPFFTTKPVGRGTGLGLAMVYSTVQAHHGAIDLQSEPGRGTRVRLTFPILHAPAGQAPDQPAGAAAGPGALDVLLVDDDELIQQSVRMLLEALGHTVRTAGSGEAGLENLLAGPDPDLVILDMNMPGLGGGATLDRLRALHPDLPVLLATGRVDQTALDLVQAHAKVFLLAKPFGLQDLRRQLELCLA